MWQGNAQALYDKLFPVDTALRDVKKESLTRRELLAMGTSTLVGSALLATAAKAESAPDRARAPWRFLAVNDLHFQSEECRPWFERVVAAMKASAPDARFCLLGGDLADEGRSDQLTAAREVFSALQIPLHATPGNHDYRTDDDRSAYESELPNQINGWFEEGGWQFIGLDTTQGTLYDKTTISAVTLDWLDSELPKLQSQNPTVVYTHFPLGGGVQHRPLNADLLLERLRPLNVQAIFSGHWHSFTESRWQSAILTTNRCCSRVRNNHDGTAAKGWFVCEVAGAKLTRRFVEIPPM